MRSSRLTVVHLALSWPTSGEHAGGVGRYVQRLVTRLREDVDQVVVAGTHNPVLVDGVRFCALPSSGRLDRYYRAPLRASALVTAQDADVLHAHGDDWGLRVSIPVLRTFYGSSMHEARTSGGLRRINHYLLALTESVSARRADLRTAIATESARRFRAEHLVPPVLDLPKVTSKKDTRPCVVFVGGYASRKRGWLALQAVQQQRHVCPEVGLTVIGPGTDRHRYPEWVTYVAGADDEEVLTHIAQAWVLLAPSTYEGFGIPAFEALAVGTAVLATPNPGSREVLGNGRFGVLADAAGLPGALSDLLEDDVRREDLVTRGRQQAVDLVDRGSPGRLVGLYHELADQRRAKA